MSLSGGDYTTPPDNQFDELVTGGGLSDASITITMGAYAASILQPGSYLIPPTNPVVQETTSGGGTGVQFSLLYGGDLAAGSVVYDEIVDVGPDALLASMTYDADDYTSTSFEQPIDQPPYYTGLGAVDTTIVPGNNAANFTGWNTSTSSPPSAIVQPMPIDTTTSAGTVGTISGQIAVDMRTYDGINDGTSTAAVLEIQIFNTPQTDEQLAAIRTSIANYFGFIPP